MRIGVVGCGAVAELYYAPVLRALQQKGVCEKIVLFDPDFQRAKSVQNLLPFASIEMEFAAFAEQGIDLAIVASPPRFHCEHAMAMLDRGVSVLCEKPMALTVVEAERMIRAADRSDSLLAVGLFRRLFPSSEVIREVIQKGRLGRPMRFEVSEGGPFQWPARSASFFNKSTSGGGVLADLGVHSIDLLLWWFGATAKIDYADDSMGGLEANCIVSLVFENGVTGKVRLSRDTELPNRTLIECEHGRISCKAGCADALDVQFGESKYALNGSLFETDGNDMTSGMTALNYHQSFALQLSNVIRAIRGEEGLIVSGREGLRSLSVIEQCYENKGLMEMGWLSPDESAAARLAFHHG